MAVKPIGPEDVVDKKEELLPDAVITAFNELIAEEWDGYHARVFKDDAVKRIKRRLELDITEYRKFDVKWLEVEDIYRKRGWEVEYDAPGYCESYRAYYLFSKKEK